MALLSLETWANRHSTIVLAISSDEDWSRFASESDHIVCIEKVPVALDHFNREAEFVARRISALLKQGRPHELNDQIKRAIEAHFDDTSIEIEAESDMRFEAEFQGVQVLKCTATDSPHVISYTEEEINLVIDYICELEYSAYFEWFVRDQIDHDDISINNGTYTRRDECIIQMAITFSQRFEGEPDIYEVAVSQESFVPDFGYVRPRWEEE